jgi:hypothetical protein
LPKKPSEAELKVIKEMFEASVDGQPYDTERWGQYYRPAGVQAPAGSKPSNDSAPAAKPTPAVAATADVDDTPPFDVEESTATAPVALAKPTQKAEDILAMIRARQQK